MWWIHHPYHWTAQRARTILFRFGQEWVTAFLLTNVQAFPELSGTMEAMQIGYNFLERIHGKLSLSENHKLIVDIIAEFFSKSSPTPGETLDVSWVWTRYADASPLFLCKSHFYCYSNDVMKLLKRRMSEEMEGYKLPQRIPLCDEDDSSLFDQGMFWLFRGASKPTGVESS